MTLDKKLLLTLGLGLSITAFSQNLVQIRPVLTGAPFLRISPDARADGMGDNEV